MNQYYRKAKNYLSQLARDPIPYCYMIGITLLFVIDNVVIVGPH